MDAEFLWKKFDESGSVEDYLRYCEAKNEMDLNNDYIGGSRS